MFVVTTASAASLAAVTASSAICAVAIVPSRDEVGYFVASVRSKAGVASVAPSTTSTPP